MNIQTFLVIADAIDKYDNIISKIEWPYNFLPQKDDEISGRALVSHFIDENIKTLLKNILVKDFYEESYISGYHERVLNEDILYYIEGGDGFFIDSVCWEIVGNDLIPVIYILPVK